MFNHVALAVNMGIEARLDRAGGVGLKMSLGPALFLDCLAQRPGVIGRIGDDLADIFQPGEPRCSLRTFTARPYRQITRTGRPSGVDPGRQPAKRTPNAVILSPPSARRSRGGFAQNIENVSMSRQSPSLGRAHARLSTCRAQAAGHAKPRPSVPAKAPHPHTADYRPRSAFRSWLRTYLK